MSAAARRQDYLLHHMYDGLPDSYGSAAKLSLSMEIHRLQVKLWETDTDCPQNSKPIPQWVICESCEEPLGIDEAESGGVRLYKWNLCLRIGKDAVWQTLQVQTIVCAQLLALIEGQATSKFLVYSGRVEDAREALMVSHLT